MLELEQEENSVRDQLAPIPIEHNDGFVDVPDGPGLGIEIDCAVFDAYRVA
jgi:D-galactarolactone cycloisomerase